MSKWNAQSAGIYQPDENGMAYIDITEDAFYKTIQRTVNLDLNVQGEVIGIEIFDCPPIALIKGENK